MSKIEFTSDQHSPSILHLPTMLMYLFFDEVPELSTREKLELRPEDNFSLSEYRHRLVALKQNVFAPDPTDTVKIDDLVIRVATLVTKDQYYIGLEIPDTIVSLLDHLFRKTSIYHFSSFAAPFLAGHRDKVSDQLLPDEMCSAVRYKDAVLIDVTPYLEHLCGAKDASWMVLTDDSSTHHIVANSQTKEQRLAYVKDWMSDFVYDVHSMWAQHDLMHFLAGDHKIPTIGEIDHG